MRKREDPHTIGRQIAGLAHLELHGRQFVFVVGLKIAGEFVELCSHTTIIAKAVFLRFARGRVGFDVALELFHRVFALIEHQRQDAKDHHQTQTTQNDQQAEFAQLLREDVIELLQKLHVVFLTL